MRGAKEAKTAGLLLRVVAKSVDVIIILAAVEILPKAGFLAGVGYMLIGDGLSGGRSLGKRLLGLVVLGKEGLACQVKESILRNITLGGGIILWKVPIIGWILAAAVFALEFIILIGSPEGRRIGDEIANTRVVEARLEEAV
ncbi:MAG: RDD family protein [Nitrospiraceae bacterium]|nr:RDD family protein [Nitrospiraceae bacterium]MDA8326679.1 RDD family protein [Nitrospiraceae bacterium]